MTRIPLAAPRLGDREVEAAAAAILSGWVTQGPRVRAFEAAFAAAVGAPYACAVSNGTAALQLALLAVGVRPGDTVITVSHSFIATANAIRACRAEPVFVDIDPETLNMDPAALDRSLSADFERRDGQCWYRDIDRIAVGESPLISCRDPRGRLAAIVVVHQVGLPAPMPPILELARASGVPVVEDAACALGSEFWAGDLQGWERLGKPHGDVAIFSFHPRKVITTGDGGMLTTADPGHDRMFRLLRQHGMSVSDLARHAADTIIFEEYVTTGFNYRLTDVQAAIGLAQLERLPALLEQRRVLAERYAAILSEVGGLRTPKEPPYARTNWQSYIVTLDCPSRQRMVMQELKDRGIDVRPGVMCAHLERPYSAAWPPGCLPQSERARRSGLILPLHPAMTDADVETVAAALSEALPRPSGDC